MKGKRVLEIHIPTSSNMQNKTTHDLHGTVNLIAQPLQICKQKGRSIHIESSCIRKSIN